jgi:uncharacterized protein (UPF0264 family)
MRLLVSVRSAAEAAAAVAGGADIIDAKEPARGSLGPVEPAALDAIANAVPHGMALSVALGDLQHPADVPAALALLGGVPSRPTELFVKVGLGGVRERPVAEAILATVVERAGARPCRPAVVAVAYADHQLAGALPRDVVARLAADAGAQGVLLDTWEKDGRHLFDRVDRGEVQLWLETSRRRGLMTALAGSLSAEGVRVAARLGADVVGVRGAACEGGRCGVVMAGRVRQLAAAIQDRASATATA